MHNFIKQTSISLGFDAFGIAKADALTEDAKFLQSWLENNHHGDMAYLARNFEKRTDPRKLVPGCKSVVVVLMNYYPGVIQLDGAPIIAKYAYSKVDYHTVLKAKLNELENRICAEYGQECVCKDSQHLFVDSAPVLERRWAERAGLGWLGKHTQLIHPGLGSYTFIGVLMLNVETNYDSPLLPHCGTCTRCIDACPTKALSNGSIDARKCISYLTIENKKEIPTEFQDQLSGYVLGCDICADVCPWNKKWAQPNNHPELSSVDNVLEWDAENWRQLTIAGFNQTFRNSAIKRAGFSKFMQTLKLFRNY